MRAAILESAPRGLRVEEIPMPEPRAVPTPRASQRVRGVPYRPSRDEGGGGVPDTGDGATNKISGTVAALGPGVAGPPVGTRVVSAFIMPCGFCTPCGAGRDHLCDSFFAMNRLKGTLYDGTSRLRRATARPSRDDSMAGLARSSSRRPTSSHWPTACR